jgi:very-short-patch-repair endonuclease
VNRARVLRKKATHTERDSLAQFAEPKFRRLQIPRQHPFECYILDFYYLAAKLAIELDGGGHSYRLGQIRDRKRSELFARGGVVVLRFWNH